MDLKNFDLEKFRHSLENRCQAIVQKAAGGSHAETEEALARIDGLFDGIFLLVNVTSEGRNHDSEIFGIAREVTEEACRKLLAK